MRKLFLFLIMLVPVMVFAQDSTAVENPTIGGMDLSTIINVVLVVVTAIFGGIWAIVKTKLNQALNLLKVVTDAVSDNTVTKEELNGIIAAAKALIGRS